jgi:uncharacterized repeat protein (TIGR01451 family)/LPXTG-motif cell wall-anchored protein
VVTSCIFWGDGTEISSSFGTPQINYCDIQKGYSGTSNINLDPLFVDSGSGNLHLRPGSPCIDKGSNAAVPSGITTDFEGDPRILNGTVDMGADEAGLADLAIEKTAGPSQAVAGMDFTYDIQVTNQGLCYAHHVQVSEPIPAGTTYVNHTVSHGSYDPFTGLWNAGDLAYPGSATMQLIVKIDSGTTGSISNNATVTGDELDPFPASNGAFVSSPVETRADLSITKTGDSGVVVGTKLIYIIKVTNNGPSDATEVNVTDLLKDGVIYYKSTPSKGTYDSGTGIWTVGGLTGAETETLTLEVIATALPNTVITNTAQVLGNEIDPDTTNNSASLDTRIGTSVGGEVVSIDKSGIITPWLALVSIVVVGGAFLLFRRRKAN